MKFLAAFGTLAFASVVVAQPHGHGRHHVHQIAKRDSASTGAGVYVPAPVETVIVYELNGRIISEDEVREGIANGTLAWGDDGFLSSSFPPTAAQPTPPPAQEQENPVQPNQNPDINALPTPEIHTPALPTESQAAGPQPSDGSYQPVDLDGNCPDCGKAFPNGTYSCDQFPTGFGAVHLPNEGLGGWTGIQDPVYRGADGLDNIWTAPKGSCTDGSCCTPGRFCSYACPNPYLKLSFPKIQGRTGQSVGGLYCNSNGKLEMADGSIGDTLCGRGSDKFTVKVDNRLSKSVSICRTDYPGTESETLPLTVSPGETGELANPDQSKYYFWKGNPTSAQYYINKQGVPEDQACTWGTGAAAVGNWAPVVFGTSWDDLKMNAGFPSLSQNKPTTDERLDFTITFTGAGVTNPCKYKSSTQEFCNGDQCSRDAGCTASVAKGSTLTLVFSDN